MRTTEKLQELKTLQARMDALRRDLGISAPGEITYQAALDVTSDDTVVVVADGFGTATTSIVEGNCPVDYTTKFERFFASESEAESAAEQLASHRGNPRQILAAPA
jgi:hypothetical protein